MINKQKIDNFYDIDSNNYILDNFPKRFNK